MTHHQELVGSNPGTVILKLATTLKIRNTDHFSFNEMKQD
jgi:hypothetical protein